MRKKNKLYTANKWNQPLFATELNRGKANFFDIGGLTFTPIPESEMRLRGGMDINHLQVPGDIITPSFSTPIPGATTLSPDTFADFKKKNLNNTPQGSSLLGKKALVDGLTNIGLEATGMIGRSEDFKRGLWDRADPLHYLANGVESKVGNFMGDAGVGMFKQGVQSGNTGMMIAGAALKGAGSITNALVGKKIDQKKLNAANSGTSYLNSFNSSALSIDEIQGPKAVAKVQNAYKGGVFKKGWAKDMNADLKAQRLEASQWANRSIGNNINNIESSQMDNLLGNYSAFGGILGNQNIGAIDYDFMSDYLLSKDRATKVKDKMPNNVFGSLANAPIFALGGDIQNHGADFTTGLTEINAGNTHEENPYDGVQVGISTENGQPNLVEEGETIFNDYVFSDRINADAKTRQKFHLGKKTKISYANISKKLQKESLERPNDPISQAALRRQMQSLAEEQERQKSEMQAQKMQEAFEALPPEQQQAILQQMAMRQQQAQQAVPEEEAQQMEAQNATQPPIAEEPQPMDERQMADAQMQQQMQPQMQEQMNAYGGSINRFDEGGATNNRNAKKQIYGMLPQVYTDSDFAKWAKDNGVTKAVDWDNIGENQEFITALSKQNPALADALTKGYDFGKYIAPTGKYNWDAFKDKLAKYEKSKIQGNLPGNYAVDTDFDLGKYATIQEYENSPEYKNYTKYLIDAINRNKGIQLKYKGDGKEYKDLEFKDPNKKLSEDDYKTLKILQEHINGTSTNPDGDPVPLWTVVDKDGYFSLADDADTLVNRYRTDGKGGIFHFTPEENKRGSITTNYIINDDGTVETIESDIPKNWKNVGKYNWADEKNDNTAIYYKRPGKSDEKEAEEEAEYKPKHKADWMRYAGAAGPLVGLAMQGAGIGKYDSSLTNNAEAAASMAPVLAQYKPIGDFLAYRPMDIWQQQNRANANSRATDRALLNNSTSVGTKAAGLLANGYNSQIASGDFGIKSLEYNEGQRKEKADFNRTTNMYNADAFNKTSIANADILNRNRQFRAQTLMDIAKQQAAADAAWNQGIYGNVQALFKGLSDIGRENAQHNLIADMAADGLFGTMSDKQNIGKGFIKKRTAAKGGKISRKNK